MFYLMHDTPESEGLPPVDEWKGEKVVQKVESAHTLSSKDIFMKYILNNKILMADCYCQRICLFRSLRHYRPVPQQG